MMSMLWMSSSTGREDAFYLTKHNWDLVSLIRRFKVYAVNCIYSGNADGGSCINYIISIVLHARGCAINEKSYAPLSFALSVTKVKVHMWHKRKWGKPVICPKHSKYIFFTSGDSSCVGLLMPSYSIFLTHSEIVLKFCFSDSLHS